MEQPAKKENERGALIGIGLIVVILLIGGYSFWRNDVKKLEEARKLEAQRDSSQYYEDDFKYLDDATFDEIYLDDSDFLTLDQTIQ